MNIRAVVIGLVVGLVFGAGIASLVWALTTDVDGGNDDVTAVCGVVERTPVPNEDTPMEELRRWGIGEVMPSVAKTNPAYRQLADALQEVVESMQQLDFDGMRAAIDRSKQLCADV